MLKCLLKLDLLGCYCDTWSKICTFEALRLFRILPYEWQYLNMWFFVMWIFMCMNTKTKYWLKTNLSHVLFAECLNQPTYEIWNIRETYDRDTAFWFSSDSRLVSWRTPLRLSWKQLLTDWLTDAVHVFIALDAGCFALVVSVVWNLECHVHQNKFNLIVLCFLLYWKTLSVRTWTKNLNEQRNEARVIINKNFHIKLLWDFNICWAWLLADSLWCRLEHFLWTRTQVPRKVKLKAQFYCWENSSNEKNITE